MRSSFVSYLALILSILSLGLVGYIWYGSTLKTEIITSKAVSIPQVEAKEPYQTQATIPTDEGKTKRQLWSALQQQLKDCVVQVISQIAEFNWVEPYKTPNQGEVAGTAFFISDTGDMITNAHVVDQALAIFIQVPSLGKRRFEVDIIGVSPERDLALLRLQSAELATLKKALKVDKIPYLKLGDSDTVMRADKLMAIGFPLGQQGLKSTTGVVSGREHLGGQHFIQISAPINKGNSGGPSVNSRGEVVGVNSAGIQNAQNVGYIIPINEVKLFLSQLESLKDQPTPRLLRKPYLGVLFSGTSETLAEYLGNPPPGGVYVVEVLKKSPLAQAGVKTGDMIYKINGNPVDIHGEMDSPWNKEEKLGLVDYVSRLNIGDPIRIEYYRKGVLHKANFKLNIAEQLPIHAKYPGYEQIDYEVIGGMVVMQLTLNHILLLSQYVPELRQYADARKQKDPVLLITHIMVNSPMARSRCLLPGSIIQEVNDVAVKTLADFKTAVQKSVDSGYLTVKTVENIFVALPLAQIIENEPRLSTTYYYPLSKSYKELLERVNQREHTNK